MHLGVISSHLPVLLKALNGGMIKWLKRNHLLNIVYILYLIGGCILT